MLINFGANINQQNNEGNTALHTATLSRNLQVVKLVSQNTHTDRKNALTNFFCF